MVNRTLAGRVVDSRQLVVAAVIQVEVVAEAADLLSQRQPCALPRPAGRRASRGRRRPRGRR
eukprot:5545078-Alexandrium_andersonii.AAC.1